jgi:ubiquinone/menaquinone biosynthesis C-methylase UbiE
MNQQTQTEGSGPQPSMDAFRNVDSSADPQAFVRYLEAVSEHPLLRAKNRARADAAGLPAGSRVLDLGCGLGSDSLMLAERVGPAGQVTGLDRSEIMIGRARERAAERNLDVRFVVGDAAELPFEDAHFDAVWAERVLVHVADPARVFEQVRRVLVPHGVVCFEEFDYEALVLDSAYPAVTRRLVDELVRRASQPRIGRALRRLAVHGGLHDVSVETTLHAFPDSATFEQVIGAGPVLDELLRRGELTEQQVQGWRSDLRAADRDGTFTGLLPGFQLRAKR